MRRALILIGGLMFLYGPLGAQAVEVSDSAAIARAREFILDTMAVLRAPGAAITVIRDGRMIWSEGFGLADIEQQVPVTPLTRFRVGSVSKSLTSVALGMLVEQGRLDLDAPIQRYVPSFPEKPWPITTRELAGHLAGIRHYRGDEFAIMRHYDSVRDGLAIFQADSLLFEPGTAYSYSSYGWNLIAAVIEGASGEPFLQFMQHHVFGPAGMTRTVPEYADSIVPYRARFYVHADTAVPASNAPYVDNSYKWAGGGFLSTTEDLARLGRKLLEGKLLQPSTRDLLWASQTTRDGKATGYGMGWFVRSDNAGHRLVGHTGGSMGGTAHLLIYPDQHLVVALLVNSDRTFISALPRIAELFLLPAQ
jgi:CubicO group peptidase (beta-lactamase class C family)